MTPISRRSFLALSCTAAVVSGCNTVNDFTWQPEERARLDVIRDDFDLVVRNGPDSRVLRTRARNAVPGPDLEAVARRMKKTMQLAEGVGIAGPQVGLSLRVTQVMLDYVTEHPYTIFMCNPVIQERSDDSIDSWEGCLSCPDLGGKVRRNRWIRVTYETLEGGSFEAEFEGPNAILLQHEIDHLDGVLYVDRLISELMPYEEMRRLREAERQATTALQPHPHEVLCL